MEEAVPSVDSVGGFRVTSREGEAIMAYSDITEEDIKNLPEKSNILEIGSGVFQEFSQKIKSIRNDINVVSVDPTLAFIHKRENTYNTPSGVSDFYAQTRDKSQISYYLKDDYSKGLPREAKDDAVKIHELRVKNASKNGGIAALAPNFPFASKSMNLIVDCFGPGTWFCESEKETEDYLKEVYRLLADNGIAIVFPVDNVREFLSYEEDEERNNAAKERVQRTLDNLGLKYSLFQKDVKVDNVINQRTGVRIERQ